MSFAHEYDFPVFVGTGSVLTAGKTAQLGKGQVSLFKAKDFTVATGTLTPNTPLIVAAGSLHSKDKLGMYVGGLTQSDKSIEFLVKDIISFERSLPLKASAESWVIGWDGVNDCTALDFKCDTEYRYQVEIIGEDVYGTYTKPLIREVGFKTECCTTDDCSDGTCNGPVDPKKYANMLRDAIMADPELKYFVQAETISSDYAATTATHRLYQISLCDDGTVMSLGRVEAAVPGKKVQRINRLGTTSTYEYCDLITNGAPAAFVAQPDIALAACGVCPSGYTLVTAKDVYVVTRALSATDDLNSPADRTTFAAAVATSYTGSTVPVFESYDAATAKVQIRFAPGTVVTPVNSDIIQKVLTTVDTCTPPAGASTAWVAAGDRYRIQRTLCVTLQKECGTQNRLADIQAFYANDPTVVAGSIAIRTAGTCNDVYEIKQWSNECSVDGCLTSPVKTFPGLQSFEGFQFAECPCLDPAEADLTVKTGVIVTAAYVGTTFSGPSFNPNDYYSVRPLRVRITALVNGPGIIGYQHGAGVNICDALEQSRRLTYGQMSSQSGEFVLRQYIKAKRYSVHGEFYHDVRLREVLDSNAIDIIDTKRNYVTYHLKVQQNRRYQNHVADFSPEIYEMVFVFPEGTNLTAFERSFEAVTSQNGVYLTER